MVRKKWAEAEERTLIRKYGEMVSEGTLARLRTREKKFRPIALYVNSAHHARDPVAYPWLWTWKDVSTKIQNMRHQYLLVKQKIKRLEVAGSGSLDEFDWVEGLTHWSNFLLYKEVFGDVPASNGNDLTGALSEDRDNGGELLVGSSEVELVDFGSMVNSGDRDFPGIDVVDNGVMDLEFDCVGEDGVAGKNCDHGLVNENENVGCASPNSRSTRMSRLKGLEKSVFGLVSSQLGKLREMEVRMEQHEMNREHERKRREIVQVEREREWERKLEMAEKEREERDKSQEMLRRHRIKKWEAMELESEERKKRRREEELIQDREWENMMNMRRLESKRRIDVMLNQHRAEMGQAQARLLHEQQNLSGQFLGIIAQCTGHPAGFSDHAGASNHYFSQMMQNFHHVNAMVNADAVVDGDTHEDQFIVDG